MYDTEGIQQTTTSSADENSMDFATNNTTVAYGSCSNHSSESGTSNGDIDVTKACYSD